MYLRKSLNAYAAHSKGQVPARRCSMFLTRSSDVEYYSKVRI